MTKRVLIEYGYKSDTIEHEDFTRMITRYANGTVELEDGTMMLGSEYDRLSDVTEDAPASPQPRSLDTSSSFESEPSFNISGGDIDERRIESHATMLTRDLLTLRNMLVATYKYETQQEPNGDAIDIIGLSELYIRAQISDSNNTADVSNQTTTVSQHRSARHARRHGHGHGHNHMTPRRTYTLDSRAVDGPIQCGEGSPCKDGACCNKDGKW